MRVHAGGRPPGLPKTGGRQKGGLNKTTRLRLEAEEAAKLAADLTPLDFLLAVIRDTELPVAMRLDAARSAMPYYHRKLDVIEVDRPSTDDRCGNITLAALDAAFADDDQPVEH